MNFESFFASSENKSHLSACAGTVQLFRHDMCCHYILSILCPISAEIRVVDSQSYLGRQKPERMGAAATN